MPAVRRITVIAFLALGLAGCGGSGAKDTVKIKFGRTAGTIVPYTITIAPGGAVTSTGIPPAKPAALTSAKDEELSRLVRNGIGKLETVQCAHTFPDEATYFITALGKTVYVRGTCEPGFTKLYDALTTALNLNA